MGEQSDGSSAARSAQDPDTGGQQGLFSRLISALSPTSEQNPDDGYGAGQASGGGAPSGARPNMGNLRRLRVDDVAVPKADIIAVSVDISKDDLVQVFRDSGISRLPVYEGSLDRPLGLVLFKDLALQFGFGGPRAQFNLRAMLRPLIYAPASMTLAVMLQRMQTERTHMALVIDEYGGVDGLVTIEDLIETVIGEIEDEHDTDDGAYWVVEKPGVLLAQARTPLDEFEAAMGLTLLRPEEEEEIDTLGGLVFVLCGHVPAKGEVVSHDSGLVFEVLAADPRRIKRLRIRLPEHLNTEVSKVQQG